MGNTEQAPSKRVRIVLRAAVFTLAAAVPGAGLAADWTSGTIERTSMDVPKAKPTADWTSGKTKPTADWTSGKTKPTADWTSKVKSNADWTSARIKPNADWTSRVKPNATGRARPLRVVLPWGSRDPRFGVGPVTRLGYRRLFALPIVSKKSVTATVRGPLHRGAAAE